jgi:hypothetical protein
MIFVKIGELLFISSLLISFEAEFTVRNELLLQSIGENSAKN